LADETQTNNTGTDSSTATTEDQFSFEPKGTDEQNQYVSDEDLNESTTQVPDSLDRLGNVIKDNENKKNYTFGTTGLKVFGMPLNFNPISDPFGRVYEKTFEDDIPLVFITPGKPLINKKLISFNEGGGKINIQDIFSGLVTPDSFGVRRVRNFNDLRFVRFSRDYTTYYKYVQTMLSYVYLLMGFDGNFVFEDYYKEADQQEGIAYYADKSTSISESSNNSYGQSSIASNVNSIAGQAREYRQYLGMQKDGGLANIIDGIAKVFESAMAGIPVIGTVLGALGPSLAGSQLYYPDLWQDGKFSRSYNISFKFFSPYGDPESIFRNVYVPFISLLALSLPRQDGIFGYKEPFLVRVSSPGYFGVECGAITSIDFKRSGSDNLWTAGNFPNEIEVSLSIQDLYPTVISSDRVKDLKYNIGLSSFLECMSGISFSQLSVLDRARLNVDMNLNSLNSALTFSTLRNKFGDIWSNLKNNTARSM